jgi:glycerol kinase
MERDAQIQLHVIKVDGGASANDALLQFQADILGVRVCRPIVAETTALGAAYLAGLAVGFWNGLDDLRQNWVLDREFTASMPKHERESSYRRWKQAVSRVLNWEDGTQ